MRSSGGQGQELRYGRHAGSQGYGDEPQEGGTSRALSVKPTALTKLLQVMDQILKVLSVCESQNSDTDQLEYQPRHSPKPNR